MSIFHASISDKEKITSAPEDCVVFEADTLLMNMATAKVCAAGISAPNPCDIT